MLGAAIASVNTVAYRYVVATVRTPPNAWISAALDALATGGPDAVRVEALAASLGVSKGGFYWHFSGRRALLEQMLDTWEKAVVDDVIARVERQPVDPRAKLRQLFELAALLSAADDGLAVELAIRDWARRDATVAERLHRVDNRRMQYLRSLFRQFCADDNDAEARSMLAFALFIGNNFIAADHGALTRSQVLRLALGFLLEER